MRVRSSLCCGASCTGDAMDNCMYASGPPTDECVRLPSRLDRYTCLQQVHNDEMACLNKAGCIAG